MRKRGQPIVLPPNPAPYLTDWLMEIGPTISTGMGPRIVEFGDLVHWQSIVGPVLAPWEARVLRNLSATYLNEHALARKPDRPMPWLGTREQIASNRDTVAMQVKAAFSGLRRKP